MRNWKRKGTRKINRRKTRFFENIKQIKLLDRRQKCHKVPIYGMKKEKSLSHCRYQKGNERILGTNLHTLKRDNANKRTSSSRATNRHNPPEVKGWFNSPINIIGIEFIILKVPPEISRPRWFFWPSTRHLRTDTRSIQHIPENRRGGRAPHPHFAAGSSYPLIPKPPGNSPKNKTRHQRSSWRCMRNSLAECWCQHLVT